MTELPSKARIAAVIESATVPLSVRDVAHLARVSPSSAHRAVAALAQAGRVRRRRVRGDPRVYIERAGGRPTAAAQPTSTKARLRQLSDLQAPVWVLHPEDFADYGIKRRLPPMVLIAERWLDRVEVAPLRYAIFKHSRPLELEGELPEVEVFIAMLQLEPTVAKEMWEAGVLKKTDPRRLRRRLRAEGLEGPAASVGVVLDRRRRPPRSSVS
jgi:hypothetical protein